MAHTPLLIISLMAAQYRWTTIASCYRNNIPQFLKLGTLSMRSTSGQIKQLSNSFKGTEGFCTQLSSTKREFMPDEIVVKHEGLVQVVRKLITNVNDVKIDHLIILDVLQQIGLDYHFEDEINLILEGCHMQFIDKDFCEQRNLYDVSLCFRILRQNGFHVSTDVFKSFMRKNGKFEEQLENDIIGLMELYEASQLGIKGEDVLDEAAKFSRHMLEETIRFLDDDENVTRMIKHTLEYPQRKSLTTSSLMKSTKCLDITIMQGLAELECKIFCPMRTMELNQISRWWKDVGFGQDLCRARNEPLKWYIWPTVALTNPIFSQQRVDLTKTVSLIYIVDDIFDIYGTVNDLILFTKAVKRWDFKSIEELPYYMKSTINAVYDITNEIARKVYEKDGFNPIQSLQKSWTKLFDAFLVEAKWFASGHIPTSEEYLQNGIISSGVEVFLVHMFFLLGDGGSKEDASLIDDDNGIISSVSEILRLSDDLEGAQDVNQEGYDGSYVKCFLKEHNDSSNEIARENVLRMISDTWKCLNKECMYPNPFSKNFTNGCVNIAKLVPLMYSYGDCNSVPPVEEYILSLLCGNSVH